jgi:hypothetical protein
MKPGVNVNVALVYGFPATYIKTFLYLNKHGKGDVSKCLGCNINGFLLIGLVKLQIS